MLLKLIISITQVAAMSLLETGSIHKDDVFKSLIKSLHYRHMVSLVGKSLCFKKNSQPEKD